jgi:hypothetical protein
LGSNHIKGVCVWLYMGFGKIEHEWELPHYRICTPASPLGVCPGVDLKWGRSQNQELDGNTRQWFRQVRPTMRVIPYVLLGWICIALRSGWEAADAYDGRPSWLVWCVFP